MRFRARLVCFAVAVSTACCPLVHAAERINLRNGFALICDHRTALDAERVRLFFDVSSSSYLDVSLAEIETSEAFEMPLSVTSNRTQRSAMDQSVSSRPVSGDAPIDTLIRKAGEDRRLNVDLLRSIVRAESGGQIHAVSRTGAQGLMQLMPATAQVLGVSDSFVPEQNLRGGTDYLDTLLHRYHDDLALALAAYNAGPGAVDRYHGVPPYRETQLYVARIIREFNRRTLLAQRSASVLPASQTAR